MEMAVHDVELLFGIIGDLSFIGYKVALSKLYGYSLQECANKYRITKRAAQYYCEKSVEKKYDIELRRMFNICENS